MNNQKEKERAELHKTIWSIANDLRWSVDWWDFKSYVLWILFYRFISENLTSFINELERSAWNPDFDYAKLSDEEAEVARDQVLLAKGFYILPSELFQNIVKVAKTDDNLNVTLSTIFKNIENSAKWMASEDDLNWLFDDIDVNSKKLWNTTVDRNKKLVKLLETIWSLNLWYADNTIDAFWDAYEYLMTMYASNAGKSWWEFFTPQEVSELLARIVTYWKTQVNKVYDPACWSGSLLLKFASILWKENVKEWFFWQEINITTYNLCRINMFLHDINYNKFDIALWDTLLHPAHESEEPFDAIVSNPPYSTKWEWDDNPLLIDDERFSPAWVLAPKSKADLAFTMHMLKWLSAQWTAAIVEFPWVLYRWWAEQKIRKYLIDNNFVDTVIQLPADLFFWVTIATCIIVLKKNKKDTNIVFIDWTNEFVRWWNKNKLTEENQQHILDAHVNRENVEHFVHVASYDEVKNNDYNLSVSTYVEAENTAEEIDIDELNRKIAETVEKENRLRAEIDKIIKENFSS